MAAAVSVEKVFPAQGNHKSLNNPTRNETTYTASQGRSVKNPLPRQATQETWVQTTVQKTPWSREWQPAPVFSPRKFHGRRSLAGYSSWGHKLRLSARAHTHIYTHTHTHTHTHTEQQLYQRILNIPAKIVLLASSNKSSQSFIKLFWTIRKKNSYFPEHLIWCQLCFDKGNTTEKKIMNPFTSILKYSTIVNKMQLYRI